MLQKIREYRETMKAVKTLIRNNQKKFAREERACYIRYFKAIGYNQKQASIGYFFNKAIHVLGLIACYYILFVGIEKLVNYTEVDAEKCIEVDE